MPFSTHHLRFLNRRLTPARASPCAAGAGVAAGVGLAGLAGYGFGSVSYPILEPGLSRLIDNICLSDPDLCYNRWQAERDRCWQWQNLGIRQVRACQSRAKYRFGLCYKNNNRPDPGEPPEWSPFRDYMR